MTSLKKQVALCTLGTLFEWYEFTVFASLAPFIALLFFPQQSHFAAMMSIFAIFATGFIMRPIGALFFGHLGDTLGRKYTLLITVFLMSGATLGMGLIPTGTSFSTIALILCRLIQGFATSGEYPGCIALLAEQGDAPRKGFVTSFSIFATGAGGFCGALVYASIFKILGYDNMLQWGWRLPFLLGAPLGIFGFILRRGILESVEFKQIKALGLVNRFPLKKLFREHSKTLLTLLVIYILSNTLIYIDFYYFSNYALSLHYLNVDQAANLYLTLTFIYSIAILISGYISDYVNKKNMILIICIAIVLFIYPLFDMATGKDIILQFLAEGVLAAMIGCLFSPLCFIAATSFPAAIRYSALSFIINIAASIFGGTAPMICSTLTQISHLHSAPALYIMMIAIISLLFILSTSRDLLAESSSI